MTLLTNMLSMNFRGGRATTLSKSARQSEPACQSLMPGKAVEMTLRGAQLAPPQHNHFLPRVEIDTTLTQYDNRCSPPVKRRPRVIQPDIILGQKPKVTKKQGRRHGVQPVNSWPGPRQMGVPKGTPKKFEGGPWFEKFKNSERRNGRKNKWPKGIKWSAIPLPCFSFLA